MMQVKGYNGTVTLDGNVITIDRTRFAARVLIGSGSKTIPVEHITAVQLVPAKFGFRGFIQFTVGGGIERRATLGHRTTDAAQDENSVMFNRHQQLAFQELRAAIEQVMFTSTKHNTPSADPTDQLARLAELRDSGALSADEFVTAKARILR